MKRFFASIIIVVAALAGAKPARACSTCMCGDPTLTSMGLEKPYADRMRFSLVNSFRSETAGSVDQNRIKTRENRVTLNGSYSFDTRTTVAAYVPVVWKDSRARNGATEEVFGLGDAHLQARFLIVDPRHGSGDHLFGVIAGTMLPTGPVRDGSSGEPLSVQTGTGAWLGEGGLWYAGFAFPWSAYASATAQLPLAHREHLRPGVAVLTNAGTQYQITAAWAVQGSVESRWAARNEEFGEADANSGGWITFLSPRILYSPKQDVLLQAGAQFPVLEKKSGFHEEGITISGGIIYDF